VGVVLAAAAVATDVQLRAAVATLTQCTTVAADVVNAVRSPPETVATTSGFEQTVQSMPIASDGVSDGTLDHTEPVSEQ
jgi:hypothetical protein